MLHVMPGVMERGWDGFSRSRMPGTRRRETGVQYR